MWYIVLPNRPIKKIGNLKQTKDFALKILSKEKDSNEMILFSFESQYNYIFENEKFRRIKKKNKKKHEVTD